MSLSINHNPSSSFAIYSAGNSSVNLKRSLEKLSSGSRINTSFDDAGGLAVSMKLSASIRRTDAAIANVNNAVSFLQTQDGALAVADKLLNRMSELTSLAMDITKNPDDIDLYQTELESLQAQLYGMLDEEFNGQKIFNTAPKLPIGGIVSVSFSSSLSVVSSEDGKQTVDITQADLSAVSYTVGGTPDHNPAHVQMKFDNAANIKNSLELAKNAIDMLALLRAHNGAQQSRLEVALSTLGENKTNLQVADGRIQDVDIGLESTALASHSIRHEAATAMLAQANQGHQVLLRLLGY
jgi:flagellin